MFPDFSGFIYLAYAAAFGAGVTLGLVLMGLAAIVVPMPLAALVLAPVGIGIAACVAFRIWVGE